MIPDQTPDPVRQQALTYLTAQFVAQGHPEQYAVYLATTTIFQADLDLRNAQMSRLLAWLKQEQPTVYPQALALVESTREEFENRVQRS
ncbi:MAG: hypothetical protein SFW36_03925 [Leptolyngbyaceae cyanobacterium bins.59]|nr:hypothetical protein [Leptolyngbyaceae cyanobacterium bins.59]